jgi:hypothetical protein
VERRRPKRSAYTDAGKSPAWRIHAAAQYADRRDNILGDKNVQQKGEVDKELRTRNMAVSSPAAKAKTQVKTQANAWR